MQHQDYRCPEVQVLTVLHQRGQQVEQEDLHLLELEDHQRGHHLEAEDHAWQEDPLVITFASSVEVEVAFTVAVAIVVTSCSLS